MNGFLMIYWIYTLKENTREKTTKKHQRKILEKILQCSVSFHLDRIKWYMYTLVVAVVFGSKFTCNKKTEDLNSFCLALIEYKFVQHLYLLRMLIDITNNEFFSHEWTQYTRTQC